MGNLTGKRRPIVRAAGEGSLFEFVDARSGRTKWRSVKPVLLDDGTRKRISGEGATRAEAIRRANANVDAALNGTNRRLNARARKASPTLTEWFKRWYSELSPEVKPTRRKQYLSHAGRYILPELGDVHLHRLTIRDVRLFANQFLPNVAYDDKDEDKRLSPSAIRNIVAVLRVMLDAAVQDEMIPSNPAAAVRVGKGAPPTVLVDRNDAWKVISTAAQHRSELRWMLSLNLGLRQSEALGLTWSRVRLDEQQPYMVVDRQLKRKEVFHGCGENKNGLWACGELQAQKCPSAVGEVGLWLAPPKTSNGRRELALSPLMVKLFREHKEMQFSVLRANKQGWKPDDGDGMDDLVFTNWTGKPIRHGSDTEDWHTICADAGVDYERGHLARHVCASLLAASSTPVRVTMVILGHGSSAMSHFYQHVARLDTALPLAEVEQKLLGQARLKDVIPKQNGTLLEHRAWLVQQGKADPFEFAWDDIHGTDSAQAKEIGENTSVLA